MSSSTVKFIVSIFMLFLLHDTAIAQKICNTKVVHQTEIYQPGIRHSIAFEVSNISGETKRFRPELTLPTSWELATSAPSITLAAEEKGWVFMSFFIPSTQMPGVHQAIFILKDIDRPYYEKTPVFFEVDKHHDLQVRSLTAPKFTQAGELIEVTFEVINRGNIKESVRLSSLNSIQGATNYLIAPDSSILVKVHQKTDARAHYVQSINCNLEVFSVGTTQSKKAYSSTKVFPTKIAAKDAFFRYPIEASIYFNSYRSNQQQFNSRYFEVKGNGFLDAESKHYLNFIVRGPNQLRQSRFGISDQYSLIYRYQQNTTLYLGDHTFNISRLGFMGRYGMGARLDHSVNHWVLSAFYTKPRLFNFSKEPIFGAKAVYAASKHLKLGVSLSSSKEMAQYYNHQAVKQEGKSGQIAVFEVEFQEKNTQIQTEVATSMTSETMDYAGDVSLSHRVGRLSYRGNATMAGENYFGSLSNSLRYANALSYNVAKWNFGVGQGYSKVHERIDTTLYGMRPYFENYYTSVGYRLSKSHFFNIRADRRIREDLSERKSFNYREKGIDYRYKYTSNFFNLSFNGRMALTQNLISESREIRNTYGHFLTANYKIAQGFSVRGNFSHNRTNRYSKTNMVTDYYLYGGGLNYYVNQGLRVSGSYNSGFSPEESYRKRDFVNTAVLAKLNHNHQIEGQVNYYINPNTVSNTELFAFIKYTFRFGVPIKKVLKQGGVQGQVFSSDPSINLKGVQLIAAGNTVRTDTQGKFELNNLSVGANYLLLDESSLPRNVIPSAPMPLEFTVAENGKAPVTIELVKAAEFTGKLLVGDSWDEYNLKGHLKLQNELFTYYAESDKNGNFKFQHVVPGTYSLSLIRFQGDNSLLPVSQQVKLEVSGKMKKPVVFMLKAKKRKIKLKNSNLKVG
ncbi:MAG: hypothetical protein RIG62_14710 [Cyclobacteriaceae bacterium]